MLDQRIEQASELMMRDINEVMLATSLASEGFLALHPPAQTSCVE